MKNEKITMQQIADRLGVTKVSVSKALNGQPGISGKLREEIVKTAKELGYRKKRSTANARHSRLAFVTPKRFFLENENFYTTIFYYLNRICQSSGWSLSSFVIDSGEEGSAKLPETLTSDLFDGVFIAGEMETPFVEKVVGLSLPVVLIDFYEPSLDLDCIVTDNFYLGYCATDYLIRKGHREIGFVGDTRETSNIMDRYYGYRKALTLAGLPVRDEWHLVNNDPRTGVYTLDYRLPDPLPSAFVCHCDMAAYFLMQSMRKEGYSVPQDVSVISFDNTSLSRATTPALSTFDIDRREIARRAFEQMLLRISESGRQSERIYIENRLIERGSVEVPQKPLER